MRVFFSHLYHQFAWTYDLIAVLVSLGNWLDWVAEVVSKLSGPRVLELGHGPGHLLAMLESERIKSYGIDQSIQMGRLATKRLFRIDAVPLLVRGRAQSLPYHDQTFNQVVATFPSEYILDLRTLSEAYRVLVPGGKLVILPVVWITGKRWIDRAAAWLFKITGQAPEWSELNLKPLKKIGFSPTFEFIKKPSWELAIIIARKPSSPTEKF